MTVKIVVCTESDQYILFEDAKGLHIDLKGIHVTDGWGAVHTYDLDVIDSVDVRTTR